MPKFTFPLPGRTKKQPGPMEPPEPTSKAHRILGSSRLGAEPPGSWEDGSSSGVSVSLAGSSVPTTTSSSRTGQHSRRPQREWGEDSDVIPYRLRCDDMSENPDDYSDYTSDLREQPSTSTIKSWYDKTKQPLAISQQTSASAMAKGLPPKAQKILDMDNAHAPHPKGREKPANLDLLRASYAGENRGQDRNDHDLGDNYVVRSHSVLSILNPYGQKGARRKVRKHPTHESLRPETQVTHRPATSGSHPPLRPQQQQVPSKAPSKVPSKAPSKVPSKVPSHLNELSSLYKHYEQMSFAQVMNEDDGAEETMKTEKDPEQLAQKLLGSRRDRSSFKPTPRHQQQQQRPRDEAPGPLSSHPAVTNHSSQGSPSTQKSQHSQPSSGFQSGYHTQFVHAPLPTKGEQQSPIDYAASISSRHTRTSKASRRTDRSFQLSELQDKSVLMLSSDSEDDDGAGSCMTESTKDSGLAATAPPAKAEPVPPAIDMGTQRGRDSTQTYRRMSSAPTGFFTIPTRLSSNSSSPAPSTINSRETMQRAPSSNVLGSSSDLSLPKTISSTDTTNSRLGRESYGIQEARAVTMVTARGPAPEADPELAEIADSDWGHEKSLPPRRGPSASAAGPLNNAAPTPTQPQTRPSMECFMEPASDWDEKDGLYMGLTRQEQMLIQALRQRREQMRQNSSSGSSDGSPQRRDVSVRGHQSNASEATITESSTDFDFPSPPAQHESIKPSGTFGTAANASMAEITMGDTKNGETGTSHPASPTRDGTVFVLSPPPSSHHKRSSSSLREVASRESLRSRSKDAQNRSRQGRESASTAPAIQGLSQAAPVSSSVRPSKASSKESLITQRSAGSLRRQQSLASAHGSRVDRNRSRQREHWAIAEDEPMETASAAQHWYASAEADDGPGIPRPDSPISPMTGVFPTPPVKRQTLNNPGVRLSAFGPPQAMGRHGWWGDDD